MKQRFFMEQATLYLLERGMEIPESHEGFRRIVRAAWRSAGLLVEARPETTFREVQQHVEYFLVAACGVKAPGL